MASRWSAQRSSLLFEFDQSYLRRYSAIAGVDEAGRGPLAGPVVAAAVILPAAWRHPILNDSKQLTPQQRQTLYPLIQQAAMAVGIGIVEADEIDRLNIRQASFAAMRAALGQLAVQPEFVLVDGFKIPQIPLSQEGIIKGDSRSAHIAAASILAKVTRDALMESWHKTYPHYGFDKHKGYGTPEHMAALERHGPCPIHRRSFSPVQSCENRLPVILSE